MAEQGKKLTRFIKKVGRRQDGEGNRQISGQSLGRGDGEQGKFMPSNGTQDVEDDDDQQQDDQTHQPRSNAGASLGEPTRIASRVPVPTRELQSTLPPQLEAGSVLTSPEGQILQQRIQQAVDKEVVPLRQVHKDETTKLEGRIASLEAKIEKLKISHEAECRDIRDDLREQHRKEKAGQDAGHLQEFADLRNQLQQQHDDNRQEQEQLQATINGLHEKQGQTDETTIAALKAQHSSTLAQEREQHHNRCQDILEKWQRKCATDVAQVRQEHDAEVSTINKRHQQEYTNQGVFLQQQYDGEIDRLTREHESGLEELEEEHKEALRARDSVLATKYAENLAAINKQHAEEIDGLKSRYDHSVLILSGEHETQQRQSQEMIAKQQTKLNDLEGRHQSARQHWTNELQNQRNATGTLQRRHQEELDLLKQRHKSSWQDLTTEHQRQLTDAKTRHEDARIILITAHEEQQKEAAMERTKALRDLGKVRDAAEDKLRQELRVQTEKLKLAKSELTRQMREAEQEAEEIESTHQGELKLLQAKTQAHQTELSRNHQNEIAGLIGEHTTETQWLKGQIEELNAALLSRDDGIYHAKLFVATGLPSKSDDKIREAFLDVDGLVDDLGRLAWSAGRSVLPDNVLQGLRGQHEMRMLKKAIIKDLIWSLLVQFVFAHPFRMFGEAGDEVQKQWVSSYSHDTSLKANVDERPVPGTEAERWRYMTLEECVSILTKPVPKFMTERERLKTGYQQNTADLARAIEATLADIVNSSTEVNEKISKLSKRAPRMWLDFGRHRCRIVIRLTGDKAVTAPERKLAIAKGSIKLTVSPRLGRYGNNKGADLDNFTPIAISNEDICEIA